MFSPVSVISRWAFMGLESPGDRVGLLAESRPEWSVADFAILANGAVNVPIIRRRRSIRSPSILRNSGSKVLFVSGPAATETDRPAIESLSEAERPVLILFER
jgi:long-chain acyl-CoA synthetase